MQSEKHTLVFVFFGGSTILEFLGATHDVDVLVGVADDVLVLVGEGEGVEEDTTGVEVEETTGVELDETTAVEVEETATEELVDEATTEEEVELGAGPVPTVTTQLAGEVLAGLMMAE